MARKVAETGEDPTLIFAMEQHFSEGTRLINDDLAGQILPFGMKAYVWLTRPSWVRDWMVRASENKAPGIALLSELFDYTVKQHGFDPDTFVHEITEGIIGDQYPVPDRILSSCNAIVHDYLIQEMCNNKPPKGNYELFATEGGTAAMCYIFDSLMQNFLVKRGDKIALFVL